MPQNRLQSGGESKWLLAADSPRGEQLRKLQDTVRTEAFGLKLLRPECQEEDTGPANDPQPPEETP